MTDIANAILLRDDAVLLARRSAGRRSYPSLWSFPGGHLVLLSHKTQDQVFEIDSSLKMS
jgi:ADP-ribose pyrophosphatase YjhB (NUDIX family)